MSFKIVIRNMQGESEVELSEGESLQDALTKAGVAAGCTVRSEGQTVNPESQPTPGGTYTTTPPAAKHGHR